MYRILVITPISIAGTLIMKGLVKGFQQLGNTVLSYDVRELDKEEIRKFNPNFVLGYDYGHFVVPEAEAIINSLKVPIIHYFADDPNSVFSHSGNLELPQKLAASDNPVFCWDKNLLSSLRNRTFYLPLAVDPDLYYVDQGSRQYKYDISFVGRPLTLKRLEILCSIIKNFPDRLSIFSYKKHFDTSIEDIMRQELLDSDHLETYINSYKGFLETEQELASVYAASKINLNITLDQGVTSLNYRVFEVLASKGFLLSDYKNDTAEYFENKKDLVLYKDSYELTNDIHKYLEDNLIREEIAQSGYNKVIRYHTFKQRAEKILQDFSNLE